MAGPEVRIPLRKLAARFGLIALLVMSLETSSFIAYYLVEGRPLSYAALRQERAAILEADGETQNLSQAPRVTNQSVHPYLGYVYDPDLWSAQHAGLPVTQWGFIDDKSPLQKRSEGKVIVGVFGGSVAWWYSRYGIEATIEELRQLPRYRGKEFVVVRNALGGFKQPQQLMALTYLLSLGAEYDLVINLDGFNEAVSPVLYNIPHGVYPSFPQGWDILSTSAPAKGEIQRLAAQRQANDKRKWLAEEWQASVLGSSSSGNLIWNLLDRGLRRELAELAREKPEQATRYVARGPEYASRDIKKQIVGAVKYWYRTSLLMREVCRSNGIEFFHFLQPNQYVPDSKPMADDERRIAYWAEHPQRIVVEDAYPRLRRMGELLSRAGVHFTDLTYVFKEHREPIYIDNCCHINEAGNALLGRVVGAAIRDTLARGDR